MWYGMGAGHGMEWGQDMVWGMWYGMETGYSMERGQDVTWNGDRYGMEWGNIAERKQLGTRTGYGKGAGLGMEWGTGYGMGNVVWNGDSMEWGQDIGTGTGCDMEWRQGKT